MLRMGEATKADRHASGELAYQRYTLKCANSTPGDSCQTMVFQMSVWTITGLTMRQLERESSKKLVRCRVETDRRGCAETGGHLLSTPRSRRVAVEQPCLEGWLPSNLWIEPVLYYGLGRAGLG